MKKVLQLFNIKRPHWGLFPSGNSGNFIITISIIFLGGAVKAQTNHTFTGTGDWSDASKWSISFGNSGYPGEIVDGNETVFNNGNCSLDVNVLVEGTLRLVGNNVMLLVPSGKSLTINNGVVYNQPNVATSTIQIDGHLAVGQSSGGQFTNNAGSGGTLITSNGTVTFNNGTFTNNDNVIGLTINGLFDLSGGTLNGGGLIKGTGTIVNMGTVVNKIAPGNSVGTLTVQGDITPASQIQIEVSDPATYDILNSTSGGSLNLSSASVSFTLSGTVNDYANGTQFSVFTNFGSYSGNPAITNNLSGNGLVITYNGNGVFEITSGGLPVELVNFYADAHEDAVDLYWHTASEVNNLGFEIQHSQDGQGWKSLSFVQGGGTLHTGNSYKYVDNQPFAGINYYRLKQIDFDGSFEYSKVISAEYDHSEKILNVFPNPSDGLINLQVLNPTNQIITIKIFDDSYREVWECKLLENESNCHKELEVEGSGVYIIVAQVGNKVYHERLIVANEK